MTPAEHIQAAARHFRDGKTCYYATVENGQTVKSLHNALYKAMRRWKIYRWKFRKMDAKTIYIKP